MKGAKGLQNSRKRCCKWKYLLHDSGQFAMLCSAHLSCGLVCSTWASLSLIGGPGSQARFLRSEPSAMTMRLNHGQKSSFCRNRMPILHPNTHNSICRPPTQPPSPSSQPSPSPCASDLALSTLPRRGSPGLPHRALCSSSASTNLHTPPWADQSPRQLPGASRRRCTTRHSLRSLPLHEVARCMALPLPGRPQKPKTRTMSHLYPPASSPYWPS
jgi:hypothetical protein